MTRTITLYQCPTCEAIGDAKRWIDDPYQGLCCGDCGENVKYSGERQSDYVSVAVYQCSRAYGGPEEGGWYYSEGHLIEETLRCFAAEDFPQIEVYRETLQRRYPDDTHNLDSFYRIRTHDEKIVRHFPETRPVYC